MSFCSRYVRLSARRVECSCSLRLHSAFELPPSGGTQEQIPIHMDRHKLSRPPDNFRVFPPSERSQVQYALPTPTLRSRATFSSIITQQITLEVNRHTRIVLCSMQQLLALNFSYMLWKLGRVNSFTGQVRIYGSFVFYAKDTYFPFYEPCMRTHWQHKSCAIYANSSERYVLCASMI